MEKTLGYKTDEGKRRYDLLPGRALNEVAYVLGRLANRDASLPACPVRQLTSEALADFHRWRSGTGGLLPLALARLLLALQRAVHPLEVPKPLSPPHPGDHPRYDLMPWDGLEEVVKVFEFGASKYMRDADGARQEEVYKNNWLQGMRWERAGAAFQRHMAAWFRGERDDPESGLSHLGHAACCLFMLLAYDLERERYGHYDDRATPEAVAGYAEAYRRVLEARRAGKEAEHV